MPGGETVNLAIMSLLFGFIWLMDMMLWVDYRLDALEAEVATMEARP